MYQSVDLIEGADHEGPVLEIPALRVLEKIGKGPRESLWFTKVDSENYVLAGHRFRYLDPISPPFYFLDRLETGENIKLHYQNKIYEYVVVKSFEVRAGDVWIEEGYSFPSITLYTCTPIYNPVNRLVVVGRLVSIH